jgi:hypothetical protein
MAVEYVITIAVGIAVVTAMLVAYLFYLRRKQQETNDEYRYVGASAFPSTVYLCRDARLVTRGTR